MSTLNTHKLELGSGADPRGHIAVATDPVVAGQVVIERGTEGGGKQQVVVITPSGDVALPETKGLPGTHGVVVQHMLAKLLPKVIPVAQGSRSFTKTGVRTISIKAGTTLFVAGMVQTYTASTAVVMPGVLTPGEDYGIWVLPGGTLFAAADPKPSPYNPTPAQAGAVKVGGFHYGLVPHDTQLAGGGFAQAAPSLIWTQADVNKIAGINAFSLWDEAFRPGCDPRGMACVSDDSGRGLFWFDLYFCGTQHVANGTSRAGTDVANGAVLPVIPAMFGGNGAAKYTTLNWFDANEIAQSHAKRLPTYQEFAAAAFGVTEGQSLGGAAGAIPTTQRQAGYTSKWGGEQMTGHQNIIGGTAHGTSGAGWVSGPLRGQTYGIPYAAILGGARGDGVASGSRCSLWTHPASYSVMANGMRAFCDHQRPQ